MKKIRRLLKHKRAVLIAIITGTLFSSLFYTFAWYEMSRQEQAKEMIVTELFSVYDNELNTLIYSNIYLVQGFIAYIQTYDTLDDATIYRYMENLLKDQGEIINNVGILKDTTIIWNYPYDANKDSIGVDLAKVEAQKLQIESVKRTMKPIFQGPVNLIQGGIGYILRYPIRDRDNHYWGQASIVLKADAFITAIETFENEHGITSVIQSNDRVIHGAEIQEDSGLYWFDFRDELFNWRIGLKLKDDYDGVYFKVIALFIVSLATLLIFSISAYYVVRANEIIKHESIHDHLTGLRNRNSLDETMQQVLAAASRNDHQVAILLIDLDKFKEINDTHGHAVGDEVLRLTSQKLRASARLDELIFRVGGDEFLVVIPVVEKEDVVQKVIERLREHLSFKLEIDNHVVLVNASIGSSIYSVDGFDFDTLFQIADKRMYDDKNR